MWLHTNQIVITFTHTPKRDGEASSRRGAASATNVLRDCSTTLLVTVWCAYMLF